MTRLTVLTSTAVGEFAASPLCSCADRELLESNVARARELYQCSLTRLLELTDADEDAFSSALGTADDACTVVARAIAVLQRHRHMHGC